MLTRSFLLLALVAITLASSAPGRFQQIRRRDSSFIKREHHHADLLQKRHRKPLQRRACKSKSRLSSSASVGAQTSSTATAAGQATATSSSLSNSSEDASDVDTGSSNAASSKSNSVNAASSNSSTSDDSESNTDSGSTSSDSKTSSAGLPSGITHFTGKNTGIGSWFRTNSGQDSTNGRSWCQLNYQDDWLGFAPDVSAMLSDFGNDISKAGGAYCGLEAKATNPKTGQSALIYIVDGFDPRWVKTPGSIDLTLGAFKALYGSTTDDKNVVITDLEWELTGNKKAEYSFNAGGK